MIKYRKREQELKNGKVDLATVDYQNTYNARDLSRMIEKEANFPAIQGLCIMTAMAEIIPRLLMDGNVISLEGIGTFRASVSFENEKPVVNKIVFTSSTAIKSAMKVAEFEEIKE